MRKTTDYLTVENRQIPISNLDKILYPGTHYNKGAVIDYYIRVADYLLPHVKDRPVTLKRFPNGVGGDFFYEKDAPSFTPDWVQTFPVPRRTGARKIDIRYILINDLPTLVWLANLANLEIHPFLHRIPDLDCPTAVVFDFDPGEGTNILACGKAALITRDILADLGLKSFPKVSGSKGLQLYVPLNTATSYNITGPFAKALAELLEERHPDLIVSKMEKSRRRHKVFVDWSQNSDFKTTIGVYSLRAKTSVPFVSMPVEWDEIQNAIEADDSQRLYFTADAALKRLVRTGDLFRPILNLKQVLPVDFTVGHGQRARHPRSLKQYSDKRDFSKTPEPEPTPTRSSQGSRRRFVIQKHAASHLHYDFRLEMHDVLKSWAVPKGPPYATDQKRLAMATEDHPLDYLDFEGIIPKGQYGGGTVMVWDIGTYELIEGNYYKGYLHFSLAGKKLKGEWALIKKKNEEKWFLTKVGKSVSTVSKKRDDSSAVTGRTMAQIAAARDARWQSNRGEPDLSDLPDATMKFIEPMLAKAVPKPPEGDRWQYEIKLDGYRVLVFKDREELTLRSRRGNKMNDRFPEIASALSFLPAGTIIDGEVVAMDKQGRPSFSALQHSGTRKLDLYFYAFDLLAYRAKDLRSMPLSQRRELLQRLVLADIDDPIRLSEIFDVSIQDLLRVVREANLEGIIAKRRDSKYEPGERSGAWLKYRTNQGQELVIGGYKPGKQYFEYLLAGYYEGDKLMFVGKIKNGFVPATRREVARHFKGLETSVCPFANLPERANARRGEAITKDVMKRIKWLKPELVAQVGFADWTSNNHLRHSHFAGLRDDKKPDEVVREAV